ncbi:MAG: hypothetical protein MJ096_00365 [Clostridia bacterium]|nr:hypothetical protein [Clostridia bacterium]
MKRIISTALAFALIASALALGVFAGNGVNPAGGCREEVTIRRTYPEYVVKDGVIGEHEYEKLEIDAGPETTDLQLNWDSADASLGAVPSANAEAYLGPVEY